MSYSYPRPALAATAAKAGWTVIDNMFVQESPIVVEFDMYLGPDGNKVMIGWTEHHTAAYVATKTAADERMVEIKGVMGLIKAGDFMKAHAA